MNAVEIYEKASWDLGHNKITLGEYEERIKPLYDVVEVVRCKDCKGYEVCRNMKPISENDYCSYGERKEQTDETDRP